MAQRRHYRTRKLLKYTRHPITTVSDIEREMKLHGWDAIWRAEGTEKLGDCYFVGVWSGPDNDLVCLKYCGTAEEALKYLSPGGRTLLDATMLAVGASSRMRRKNVVIRRRAA